MGSVHSYLLSFAFFGLSLVGEGWIASAIAHPIDLGILNITNQGEQFHARIELNPEVGARMLGLPVRDRAKIESEGARFFGGTLARVRVEVSGQKCDWGSPGPLRLENPQLLSQEADLFCSRREGDWELSLPFLESFEPGYRLLTTIRIGESEHLGGADPKHPFLRLRFDAPAVGFRDFVVLGMEHIGVTPGEWWQGGRFRSPKGIDHILFVLALLLMGGTLRELLRTITGFTLGHTLSLSVVAFGMVQVSGQWIEVAIALTIAWVSFEAFRGRPARHRFWSALGIGLIHGMGFSAALRGLSLPRKDLLQAVLGFNVGVELGQAILILLIWPFLLFLSRWDGGRRYVVRGFAIVIFGISIWWAIGRAYG